jgi:hypothetical protein
LLDSRGEHRRGGNHADPLQGALEALLGQAEAGQLIFPGPNQEKVHWRLAK